MAEVVEGFYRQIELEENRRSRLADHFHEVVNRAKADRRELEERWDKSQALYEGRRNEKRFPWPGASNIHVPLVSSHASAIHARFMTTLFAPEPFWRVRAKNPDFQDFATSATNFMDWARQNQFPWYESVRDFSLDAIKLGLGILKVTWLRRRGPVFRYDEDYSIIEDEITIEDRPHVESVNPIDFLWPVDYDDIQTAPWIAHVQRFTPGELRSLQSDGFLFNVAKVVGEATTDKPEYQTERDIREGLSGGAREAVEVWEIWARYDLEADGTEKEIQIFLEPNTGTILRLNPNPYFHRKRPFVVGRLEVREHRLVGTSISDQIGPLNEEINTIHNQLIDQTTTSTIQMFKVRKGSPADIGDSLAQIYPAKKIPVATMDDVGELSLGPLRVNSQPLEDADRVYAERRTGISDFSLGREPTPSRRGTATGTLAIIQEGNKKFDFQIRDLRVALGQAGMMLLELYRQMNPEGILQEILGEEGTDFATIRVAFPDEPLLKAVSVEVVAGTSSVNRQAQRQDALMLFQIMNQFYLQAFQLGQLLAQPGLPPALSSLAIRLAKGAEVMMREILDSFENRRADELLPDLEEVFSAIAAEGAAQTAQGGAGLSGLAGAIQAARGGGAGAGAGGQPIIAVPRVPGASPPPAGAAAGVGPRAGSPGRGR